MQQPAGEAPGHPFEKVLNPGSPLVAFALEQRWKLGLGGAVVAGLYLTSRSSYLLFHTLAEMFSVVVACSIFSIAWNARNYIRNGFLLFVGIAYFSLGLLDLLHTIGYTGMPTFPGHPFAANQLWVAARFIESLSLLLGFAYLTTGRRPNPALTLSAFVAVTALVIAAIFLWRVFPVCFVAGQGQTRFKILSEYAIISVLAVDAALLVRNRERFHRGIYLTLLAATVFAILTEVMFTLYVSNYGLANRVGHYFKVLTYYLTYLAIVKHGVEQPYEMVFRELADANGRLKDEVRAHHATEGRFQRTFDESPIGTAIVDPGGRFLKVNDALCRFLGYSEQELLAMGYLDVTHPGDRPVDLAQVARLASGELERYEVEKRYLRKDGSVAWGHLNLKMLQDGPDGARYMLPMILDVTARRHLEERLEYKVAERTAALDQANRLLRVISACNEALVRATDEKELVLEICRLAVSIGGYTKACLRYVDAPGGVASGLPGRCLHTGELCLGGQACLDPEPVQLRQQANGSTRYALGFPLRFGDRTGAVLEIFSPAAGRFKDVETDMLGKLANDLASGILTIRSRAERDRARQELEDRTRMLRALASELVQSDNRERRRLAKVLHDHLQQILVAAKWRAGALAAGPKGEGFLESCRQLEDLMDEAIQSSRDLAAELSPAVLHEKGLAQALAWLGKRMKERHALDVDLEMEEDLHPLPPHLTEFFFDAIRELLFNVIKHARVARARIRVRQSATHFEATVEDAGAGFDVELAKTARSGTGLGLFSIQERLTHLGGWMLIESAPGQGSQFHLMVPLEEPLAGAQEPEAASRRDAGARPPRPAHPEVPVDTRIRILIVDDHQVVRQGLSSLLGGRRHIHVVGEASDGFEGLRLARQHHPEVVLMDINMPGINGIETTRLLQAELPGICVIGLSMHQDPDITREMLEAGARGFVSKCDPVDTILAAIQDCRTKRNG